MKGNKRNKRSKQSKQAKQTKQPKPKKRTPHQVRVDLGQVEQRLFMLMIKIGHETNAGKLNRMLALQERLEHIKEELLFELYTMIKSGEVAEERYQKKLKAWKEKWGKEGVVWVCTECKTHFKDTKEAAQHDRWIHRGKVQEVVKE
jgi:rubrerythrin